MKSKLKETEEQVYPTDNVLRETIHTKEKDLKNQKEIKKEIKDSRENEEY